MPTQSHVNAIMGPWPKLLYVDRSPQPGDAITIHRDGDRPCIASGRVADLRVTFVSRRTEHGSFTIDGDSANRRWRYSVDKRAALVP